ncbi:hypothetical protein MKW98_008481, partial [Papaver atlanticum]
ETIRAFLAYFQNQILRRASELFGFSNGRMLSGGFYMIEDLIWMRIPLQLKVERRKYLFEVVWEHAILLADWLASILIKETSRLAEDHARK